MTIYYKKCILKSNIYNEDRGAKRKSNRKKLHARAMKGLFAEAVKTAGVFAGWAERKYLSDCRVAESYRFFE